MKLWNTVRKVEKETKAVKAFDLDDPKVVFEMKREEMLKLIGKQEEYRTQRKFYTKEDKQIIMRYVQRFNPKPDPKDPKAKVYKPPVEQYVRDMAVMVDHIFSYEFKTLELDSKKGKTGDKSQKKKEGGGEKPASAAPGQSATPEGQDDRAILLKPIYRESPDYPPQDLESCKTWWDVVVFRFNGELASVSFVIERQEETLRHEPEIQRAWLQLALNDYRTEFLRVYDHLTFFDREVLQIKELYNQESYLFANSTSLLNIKEKYLNKFDMVTPNSPLLRRYAKYLFDNFQERF